MNIKWSIETIITISAITLSFIGSLLIMRFNWKRYGLLFVLSGVTGNILCYIFIKIGFYSFPYRLFPHISLMPFEAILTVFPFFVLLGVRYSPRSWALKIPFYWVLVHVGMLAETLARLYTKIIEYNFEWDFLDSYTWWWVFLLLFEYTGGLIVPENDRKPINPETLRYGKAGFLVIHFILIVTIFLGGVYVGMVAK